MLREPGQRREGEWGDEAWKVSGGQCVKVNLYFPGAGGHPSEDPQQ